VKTDADLFLEKLNEAYLEEQKKASNPSIGARHLIPN
jgi:hypothetical protein